MHQNLLGGHIIKGCYEMTNEHFKYLGFLFLIYNKDFDKNWYRTNICIFKRYIFL